MGPATATGGLGLHAHIGHYVTAPDQLARYLHNLPGDETYVDRYSYTGQTQECRGYSTFSVILTSCRAPARA